MREIDSLLQFGLPGPSTRNESLLSLNWYYHVILRHTPEKVIEDLRSWIDRRHNGFSREYTRNPEIVYAHINRIVENFDWNKVEKVFRPRQDGTVAFDNAKEFLRYVPLNDRAKHLLAHIIEYGSNRGKRKTFGIEVRIPSRTLKSWDRKYAAHMRLLKQKGHIGLGRGYSTLGYAQTYHILTVP